MKRFYSIEDIEVTFRNAYSRARYDTLHVDSAMIPETEEKAWEEYKNSSQIFVSQASKPAIDNEPKELKCPECEGPMISRTGKYGVFWGCKKYPDCRGTRDSQGRSKAEREVEKNSNEGTGFNRDFSEPKNMYPFRKGKI